jgi:hypothetical protein
MSEADIWVSAEFQRLAEVINDYDHFLFLEWIPPEKQEDLNDKMKCFRVIDSRTNSTVLYADSLSNPVAILERLWGMDNAKNDVVAQLDTHNAAVQALQLKEQIDKREAAKDFTVFLGKNTKSRWHHEGRVRDDEFRDLGPISTVIDK